MNSRGIAACLFAAALTMAPTLATATPGVAPAASFTTSPNPAVTDETVTFDASASATDLVGTPITKYEWDLDGDGVFETEDNDPVTSESYADPAIIEISLRVTDEEGDRLGRRDPLPHRREPAPDSRIHRLAEPGADRTDRQLRRHRLDRPGRHDRQL